jgi:antirestriction protein ArdC
MKLEEVNLKTKEAVDYLVQSLEAGYSAVLTQYLGAMAKFRNYSFGNIMLIARQKPDATNVAGLRTWNSLGRFVRRGEKGILILAPMVGSKRRNDDSVEKDADTKASQPRLYGFRCVYVFDISQTDGKELPILTEVQGDVSGYRERLVKFVETQGITLNYSDKIAPAKGLSHGGKITLLSGMQPAEEFSTLAHEVSHELLHRDERRTMTTKQVRETEAEAVAFVVCQAIGLETGTAAADYIQLWHGDANLLRERLEAVQQTAAVILGAISPEAAGSQPSGAAMPGWLGDGLRFKMKAMADAYEIWIGEVQQTLGSINMSMDDWQSRWPFDFQAEYKAGTKADDAAIKANRFWWHEQNRSLKQDCRLTVNCWLPRGHQGTCQPVNSNSHGNRLMPSYERGDYVKVEFPDETTGIGEWMWVRVTRCDEEKQLVFGVLDNEPLNNYEGRVVLGSELAVGYSQIREHRKPTEFTRQ